MKDLGRLRQAFEATHEPLVRELERRVGEGDEQGAADISALLAVHQQAYFFLFVAQFEAFVSDTLDLVLKQGRAAADWRERRVWEALGERAIPAIPFLTRLALLTDRGRPEYATVKALYTDRNRIAHGTLLASPVDPIAVAAELERIAALITQESP